jgi:hypothetical protein
VVSSPLSQSHLLADRPVVAPRLPRPHLKIEGPSAPEEDPPVEAERAYCVCIGVLARSVIGEVGCSGRGGMKRSEAELTEEEVGD